MWLSTRPKTDVRKWSTYFCVSVMASEDEQKEVVPLDISGTVYADCIATRHTAPEDTLPFECYWTDPSVQYVISMMLKDGRWPRICAFTPSQYSAERLLQQVRDCMAPTDLYNYNVVDRSISVRGAALSQLLVFASNTTTLRGNGADLTILIGYKRKDTCIPVVKITRTFLHQVVAPMAEIGRVVVLVHDIPAREGSL